MAISLGRLTQHFQTNPLEKKKERTRSMKDHPTQRTMCGGPVIKECRTSPMANGGPNRAWSLGASIIFFGRFHIQKTAFCGSKTPLRPQFLTPHHTPDQLAITKLMYHFIHNLHPKIRTIIQSLHRARAPATTRSPMGAPSGAFNGGCR